MTPEQRRDKQLTVAKKARSYLDSLTPIRDVETRAALMHDKIAEGIRGICSEQQGCFNQKQTETLAAIAVHLALVMDPSQQRPAGLIGKARHEFAELSILRKLAALGAIIALLVGVGQLGIWGASAVGFGYRMLSPPAAEADPVTTNPQSSWPNALPGKPDISSSSQSKERTEPVKPAVKP
jgi:hypothetical protein